MEANQMCSLVPFKTKVVNFNKNTNRYLCYIQ